MAALSGSSSSPSHSSLAEQEFSAIADVLEDKHPFQLNEDFVFAMMIAFEAEGLDALAGNVIIMLGSEEGDGSIHVSLQAWTYFSAAWHGSAKHAMGSGC